MQKFEHNLAANDGGTLRPLAGASVTVTDKTTNLPAALYSDNGSTPLPQPLTTDSTGAFSFYAADGKYTLIFSSPRFETFTREIILEDPADNPFATRAELAAANGSALIRHNSMPLNQILEALLSTGSYVLPVATSSMLGGVKAGSGVSIASDGTLTFTQYSLPIASAGTLGGVKVGTGLSINGAGVLSTSSINAVVLLGSANVSSAVANIDFLNIFSSAYDKYLVEVQGLYSFTGDAMRLRVSTDGVTADSANVYYTGTGDGSSPAAAPSIALSAGNTTVNGMDLTIEFRAARSMLTGMKGIGVRGRSDAQPVIREAVVARSEALTGFRLFFNGGANFNGGTVRVYGVKNSNS